MGVPEAYRSALSLMDTERAIKLCKDTFERELAEQLSLTRVSAPLFVGRDTGLNDNLSGVERPVQFDALDLPGTFEIVHSLAKWKRLALAKYGFRRGFGLYTDMNAIRRDEHLDNLHSIYVDQWDWEKIIGPDERGIDTLADAVKKIVHALWDTQRRLREAFPALPELFADDSLCVISTQELEDRFPDKTPKEREDAICKERGAVLLTQIGGALKSGEPHDLRAPDYDDWSLNGDLLVWYATLNRAVELTSMGIRVDAPALRRQLALTGCEERQSLPFHKALLAGELPQTMGGGLGQSRICMLLLGKAHIGEVHASAWPAQMVDTCAAGGIALL